MRWWDDGTRKSAHTNNKGLFDGKTEMKSIQTNTTNHVHRLLLSSAFGRRSVFRWEEKKDDCSHNFTCADSIHSSSDFAIFSFIEWVNVYSSVVCSTTDQWKICAKARNVIPPPNPFKREKKFKKIIITTAQNIPSRWITAWNIQPQKVHHITIITMFICIIYDL